MAKKNKYKSVKNKRRKKGASKLNKKMLIAIAFVAVAITGVGGVGWYVLSHKAESNIKAGDAKFELGEFKTAYKLYGKAVRKDPTNLLYIEKLCSALENLVPVTPNSAKSTYDDYVGTLAHRAKYSPLDIDSHLRLAEEMYNAAWMTGGESYWRQLRAVAETGLERVSEDNPRRHELLIYRGLSSLRIEDASMTEIYDVAGNVRFPGEDDLEEVLEQDPGNATAWAAITHGRMAVYYRLDAAGNTKQAKRNKALANETMQKAVEVAGDSFEVSAVVLREKILRRTVLRQQLLIKPSPEIQEQIDFADQQIVEAAEQILKAYNPEIHHARSGEVVSLLLQSGENGLELAEEFLIKTIEAHQNDFGRKFMLASVLLDLKKIDEASKVANEILNAELQTVGLHAFELFSIRPIAAHFLIRLNLNEASITDDEEKKLSFIEEAKQYRERMFDLLSGQENNSLLLSADGSIALAEERYSDAALKLNEAISRNPDADAIVYKQAAFALQKIDSKGLAVERLGVAIEKEPTNLTLYIQKARLELQLSDLQAATMTLSGLSSTALENEEVQEVLNLIAMKQSDGTKIQNADLVLHSIAEAEKLMSRNKIDEAILVLSESMAQTPEPDWRLYVSISNAYSQKGDKSTAIDWIEKAIEISPNPKVLSPLLYSLQTDNRIEALVLTIESKDSTDVDKAEELAVSLYQLGMNLLGESNRWKQRGNRIEEKKSKELSELALERSEHFQQLAESLGADMARILSLRFTKALSESDFTKAEGLMSEIKKGASKQTEIDSLRVSLLIAKAQREQELGNDTEYTAMLETALGIAQKMVESNSISDHSWRTLGRVHTELGHLAESVDAYAESYRISPRDKENIRRYAGALATQNKDYPRLLRLLRTGVEQFPTDKQLQELWLDAERMYGESWKVLTHRMNEYAINPDNRLNMLELALALSILKPERNLLRDSDGAELYTARLWEQLGPVQQQKVLRDVQKSWNQMIDQILESAVKQVDPNTRSAHLHATIHKNLGQLSRSSEIWDRFIQSIEEEDGYTIAVISAADFLHQAGRTDQSIKLLEAARSKQSEKHEIDSVLGSLYFIGGDYGKAVEYFEPAVKATGSDTLHSRMVEALAMDGRFEEAEQALVGFGTEDTVYSAAMLKALICRVQSEQLLAQGDIEGGKVALKKYRNALRVAIDLDRRNAIPYIRLCRSLLGEYELTQDKALLEEALSVADETGSIKDRTEQFAIVRADVLQADGQLTRAIDRLEKYLSENPSSNIIRARLIEAYLDSDNVTRALAVAKSGVEVNPTSSEWHQRLGDLYLRTSNDRNEGVKSYLTAIQLSPSVRLLLRIDEMTRTDLELPDQQLIIMAKDKFSTLHPIAAAIEAKSLLNLGRKRDALLAMERSWRMFQQAIANGWISPAATGSWFLDLAHLFKDSPEEGEAFVRSLVGGPLSQHQIAGLADYYNALGNEYTEQALELIAEALALPKKDPQARARLLMMQGGFLVNVGRYKESEKSFRLLVEESGSPIVQNNLAYVIGVYQNKPEEGLKIALGAVKAAPRNTAIIDTISVLYERLGKYRTAAETFDFLLQVDPTNTRAMSKLALLYADHLDEIERGMVIANRARSQNPHSPEVLDALGWCYYRMGKIEQAEDTIRRSLRHGDTMSAYLHLAQIVTDKQDFETALGHIRMAQELAEDTYSMNSVTALKDDIRKKKTEANK